LVIDLALYGSGSDENSLIDDCWFCICMIIGWNNFFYCLTNGYLVYFLVFTSVPDNNNNNVMYKFKLMLHVVWISSSSQGIYIS
jgi:hypothetical protein